MGSSGIRGVVPSKLMRRGKGQAPGKIILFGEHAVVYGRPALAVPFWGVEARATIEESAPGSRLTILAPDIGEKIQANRDHRHPLAVMAWLVIEALSEEKLDAILTIRSTIPVASGLGSGAAVSAALGRALADYFEKPLPTPQLSSLVYEVEKLYHGTPSGIDNVVVCYGQPVYFVRGQAIEPLRVDKPFGLVVADTGVPSATKESVDAVRDVWAQDREMFEAMFDEIGEIVAAARADIEDGQVKQLGPLMTQNQEALRRLGVSSEELERLINAAVAAGAGGAKLSGGGRGGNMIAVVEEGIAEKVAQALREAGATRVWATTVQST